MPKVVMLRDQSIVDALESVLKDAKAGRLTAVAVATCGVGAGSGFAWGVTERADTTKLVGAVEMLKQRLVLEIFQVECAEEDNPA
jgi:hypothetical protein